MIDLMQYDQYLVPIENGLGVVAGCPEPVLQELHKINDEYMTLHGEILLQF